MDPFGAVWVTGPAGSGKTTVVNHYLKDRNLPCLWYTIDEGDSDIASFFYYLKWAVKAHFPPDAVIPPIMTPDFFPNQALYAKRVFEKIFALFASPFSFVFDDYQEVTAESPLHEVLCSAMSQIQTPIHMYVISRDEPPSAFARSRANCRVSLLGWEVLRLRPEETRGIAYHVTAREVSEKVIADLQAKTDGWVAGLILLLRRGEFEGVEPKILSRHTPQEIFDYFGGEIFKKLQPSVQAKLLQFAFLPKISAAAAKKITGNEDAEDLLRRLHRRNAFLNRLVGDATLFRFHPLLRDFLQMKARNTLGSEAFADLLRRSAAILVEEGDVEEGVRLYICAGEIETAVELILSRASLFAEHGRFRTLEKLIDLLPGSIAEHSPWFIYWRAICRLPYAVKEGCDQPRTGASRELFTKALSQFEAEKNQAGSYLALAGILESISMEMDDFTLLDPWIAKYDKLRASVGPVQKKEVELWLTPAVIGALVMRRPDHPGLAEWIGKGLEILRTAPNSAPGVRIFLPLLLLRILQGDLAAAKNLIDVYRKIVNEELSPLGALIFYGLHAFHSWLEGRFHECVHIADTAFQLEKQCGIRWIYPHVHGAVGAMGVGNTKLAEQMLERALPFFSGLGSWGMAFYHVISGWLMLVKKDPVRVKNHASEGLKAGKRAGNPLTLPVNYLLCALAEHLSHNRANAGAHLETALELSRRVHARQVAFGCHLVKAEIALAAGDQDRLNQALEDAFTLGRENRYVNTYFCRPKVMAELCVEALKRGIEADYVRFLVTQRQLVPPVPPRNLVRWPWPFRIRCLGGFSVDIQEEPLLFSGKTQRRPLSILKYLVAKGGRGVSATRMQDDLWPDTDGDRAFISFKTTLHRLRKLLGEDRAILLNLGTLSLNENQCWTDVWAFEDLGREMETLLSHGSKSGQKIIGRIQGILNLYKGPLLPDEEGYWAIQRRQELRVRFIDLVQRCARFLTDHGDDQTGIDILQKAISAAPLEEPLHYCLMELLHKTGKTAEAFQVFERYQYALSAECNQSPSKRMKALQNDLKKYL